jgi:hypothetical protein
VTKRQVAKPTTQSGGDGPLDASADSMIASGGTAGHIFLLQNPQRAQSRDKGHFVNHATAH